MCGQLDLLLGPGQALGIAGFDAAGKSTLLRRLVGYQEPVAGESVILDSFTNDSSFIYHKAVSAVFDEDAFFPSLSVEEHLQFIAGGHKMPGRQAPGRRRGRTCLLQVGSGPHGIPAPAFLRAVPPPVAGSGPAAPQQPAGPGRTRATPGAGIALVFHLLKSGARPLLNLGTAGAGAPVVSTAEDGAALGLSPLAVALPVLVLLAAIALAALLIIGVHKLRPRRPGTAV